MQLTALRAAADAERYQVTKTTYSLLGDYLLVELL
jgi:hypothetical protein